MKWLILAIVVFAQQPVKAPEGQGSAKGKGTQVSKQADGGKNQGQPSKQVPLSSADNQHPAAEIHSATPSANNDIEIQGKIKTFTGLLVLVGFLQFLALIGQVVIYCRQANIMVRQAHEMKRSRTYMRLQWKAMGVQAEHMKGQIAEIAAQSGILKESVDVARSAAEAAKQNIALVINKERARIMIVKPEKLSFVIDNFVAVEFKLLFYGTTPAYEVQSKVNCILSESRDSFQTFFSHGIHDLPIIVSPADIKPTYRDFLMQPLMLDQITLDKINKLEMFLHFGGIIKYNDFMEKARETAFHYRWNAPDSSPNSLRRLAFSEGWEEVGGEKENYYT